ncbi:MAG: dockerin type I domain-containing protein [Myxococcota bacterium]|nr:dockerin type I domain-containing protein [Myxococcota bacterium]
MPFSQQHKRPAWPKALLLTAGVGVFLTFGTPDGALYQGCGGSEFDEVHFSGTQNQTHHKTLECWANEAQGLTCGLELKTEEATMLQGSINFHSGLSFEKIRCGAEKMCRTLPGSDHQMHFNFSDRTLNFLTLSMAQQTIAKSIYLEIDFKQAPGDERSGVHLTNLTYLNKTGQKINLGRAVQPSNPLGQSQKAVWEINEEYLDWGDDEAAPANSEIPGDINNDGFVDLLDLAVLIKLITEVLNAPLTSEEAERADFNKDGLWNIKDLLKTVAKILGNNIDIPPGFPFSTCDRVLYQLDSNHTSFTNNASHQVLEETFDTGPVNFGSGVFRFTLKEPWPPNSPLKQTNLENKEDLNENLDQAAWGQAQEAGESSGGLANASATHSKVFLNIENHADTNLFIGDGCIYCTEIELDDDKIYNLIAGTLTMSQSNTGTRLDEDGKEISNAAEFTVTFDNLALQQSNDDEQVICIPGPLSLRADIAATLKGEDEDKNRR